ncbi:hypothetical protein [Laspinema olomoucense]|uniref:hypothetical protein n=1 Tax=Laspinema olomoucense TaxID=3231600 RepID=UPI0021BABFF4|nr:MULTISPECIES: hypothetical protein [unclassified Laspinema]MCT7973563.1 hypothetical protein [Laspinema sp. D3d]MCT7989389.1 hypothetical protein [Laspinema sp. D3a]MCT7992328.1 hypothetical protein [Laspinema sp. D3c]
MTISTGEGRLLQWIPTEWYLRHQRLPLKNGEFLLEGSMIAESESAPPPGGDRQGSHSKK